MPGVSDITNSNETVLLWGGHFNALGIVRKSGEILASNAADAGNTPTTDIRAGLLLGKDTTTGKLEEWDTTQTDGTENLFGVNPVLVSNLDPYGTARDVQCTPIIKAPLVAGSLLIKGSALVGHADEFVARAALANMGCLLDDDVGNLKAGTRRQVQLNGDTTLTSADNGSVLVCHTADAAITLPTIVRGLKFEAIMCADQELSIIGSDNIQLPEDTTANSVTFTTSGEQVGCHVIVEAVLNNATLAWQFGMLKTVFEADDFFARTVGT